MTWNKHIDIITKKENSTSTFLWHNISICSKKVEAQCYATLVRPNVEYAPQYGTHKLNKTSTN